MASAWGGCPFGLVNDPEPGSCGRYIDTDRDGLCDYSQPAPEERDNIVLDSGDNAPQKKKAGYNFFTLTIVLILLYLTSRTLAKKGAISLLTHGRIWNTILLITFLVSGLLGILLVLRVNYGGNSVPPFNILYWHVEAGIAMAVISVFHIGQHWRYFAGMIFKSNKK